MIGSVSGDGSKLFRSMYRTVGTQWDHLWVFPIGISENGLRAQRRNIIVLATDADFAQQELVAPHRGPRGRPGHGRRLPRVRPRPLHRRRARSPTSRF